jgi:aminodeoxyfutalosine deaminase
MINRSESLAAFIQAMPKAELHVHLEGSIQPATLLELARRHNQLDKLPGTDVETLRRWFTFTDFRHFIDIYLTIQDLLRTEEDFALVTYECGADMAAQNIRYREVTFTPFTHTHYQQDKGVTIDHILAGLEKGRQKAQAEFGVEIRWIFDIPRNLSFPQRDGRSYDPYPGERTLAYALAGQAKGVVGFGLGGSEINAPPEPHAGETVGPASVWGAVMALRADRIGHGVRAIEDPHLLALLKERRIPLEVNPTSNVCLHVYRSLREHPFPHLDRMGLIVTLNSDDPPLFNATLSQEYMVLAREFGYGRADLVRVARNAFEVSGAEPAVKARLLAEFDGWAAQVPG